MTTPNGEPVYRLTEAELRNLIRGVATGVRANLSAAPSLPAGATPISVADATQRARLAQADEDAAWDEFNAYLLAHAGAQR